MYEIAFFHFLGCRSAFRLTRSLTKQALNRILSAKFNYYSIDRSVSQKEF